MLRTCHYFVNRFWLGTKANVEKWVCALFIIESLYSQDNWGLCFTFLLFKLTSSFTYHCILYLLYPSHDSLLYASGLCIPLDDSYELCIFSYLFWITSVMGISCPYFSLLHVSKCILYKVYYVLHYVNQSYDSVSKFIISVLYNVMIDIG